MDLPNQLAAFSTCYDYMHRHIYRRKNGLDLPTEDSKICDDSYLAFKLFTSYVHERGGGAPTVRYSTEHRNAIVNVITEYGYPIDNVGFEQAIRKNDFASKVWTSFEKQCVKHKIETNEKNTVGPVRQFIEKLSEEQQPNWLTLLKTKDISDAFAWLDSLNGVGPKIAAFITRDLTTIMKLWPYDRIEEDEMWQLQPVDTWVARWSVYCFPENSLIRGINPETINSQTEKKKIELMKEITEECEYARVDSAQFNKGAWFVGSYFGSDLGLKAAVNDEPKIQELLDLLYSAFVVKKFI